MLRVVFLFFFWSGLSALVFEVTWLRQLSLTLGNTAQATSIVLAVFLGGLALGALLGGRTADRKMRHPLLVYGLLEIGIGILALIVSQCLLYSGQYYAWLFKQDLNEQGLMFLRLGISTVLLLLPTTLMGATLPFLVSYLAQFRQSSKMFSFLYGMNTLGAAAGSMLACFVGFTYIGMLGTICCAAAINITIGCFSCYLSLGKKKSIELDPKESDSSKILEEEKPEQAQARINDSSNESESKVSLLVLSIISFLIGFTALSYEVLWTRILRWYLTSLTYAFTIMVSMFLLGLGIGSMLHKNIRSTKRKPYLSFTILQYLSALTAGTSLIIFPVCSEHAKIFLAKCLPYVPALHSQIFSHLCYIFLVSIPTILLPAIFIGTLFPMIGSLAASFRKGVASSVGTVYAVNTVGCIFGSLICGLILMPSIGSRTAFQWIVFLSTCTGALAAWRAEGLSRPLRIVVAGFPIVLAAYFLSFHFGTTVPLGTVLLAESEDTTGQMRIIALPHSKGIMLELNGSSLAGTAPANRRYMRLMAFLPIFLHQNPEKVLVGCFGTGTTAGAASICPMVKELDIVELSKMVLDANGYFHDTNYDVLRNPKVHVHVNDVRNFLLSSEDKYDVITFEPPPPIHAGIVSLYTVEFYELVKSRLKQNGLVCQWIPMHQASTELWKMEIASAREVFPYLSIWLPNSQEAILLGSNQPIKVDFQEIQKRIDSSAQLKEALQDVGFDNTMGLMSTYLASGPQLDTYINDSLAITDNYPRLEFYLPYSGQTPTELEAESISNINDFVAGQRRAKGFDENEFWKNWKAIHFLRLVEGTKKDRALANRYIDEAINMLPENKWFKHVGKRRQVVYPNDIPKFTN